MKPFTAIILLAFIFISCSECEFNLSGHVYDTVGNPLSDVVLWFKYRGGKLRRVTKADGAYSMGDIYDCDSGSGDNFSGTLTAEKDGYTTFSRTADLEDFNVPFDITLE